MAIYSSFLTNIAGSFTDDLIVAQENAFSGTNNLQGLDGNDVIIGDHDALTIDVGTGNNSVATAINIDDPTKWSTKNNPHVGDDTVPYTTILSTGASESDYFSVEVGAGQTLTLDIDYGRSEAGGPSFDSFLTLRRENGAFITDADDAPIALGGEGSTSQNDAYLSMTIATAGTYIIQVSGFVGAAIPTGATYMLNVSVTGHDNDNIATFGDDRIGGGKGDDVLYGIDGDDQLEGGRGQDALHGGDGIDSATYLLALDDGVTADLQASQFNKFEAAGDTYFDIENIDGSFFNDDLRGDGGDNVINAWDGDDFLSGRSGDDTLIGETGNDVLTGGAGADRLDGGEGIDRASYHDSAIGVRADLQAAQFNTGIAAGDTYSEIENLRGSKQNDDLRGDAGDNLIEGLSGRDYLTGRNGDDELRGGAGDDVLNGGRGADLMVGSSGRDSFRFQFSDDEVDSIMDFQSGIDRIHLYQSAFSALSTGPLSMDNFVVGTAALDGDDYIIYDAGALYYDADGNGAVAAVQFGNLLNNAAIDAGDFLVI